jgi:hypothetical protein
VISARSFGRPRSHICATPHQYLSAAVRVLFRASMKHGQPALFQPQSLAKFASQVIQAAFRIVLERIGDGLLHVTVTAEAKSVTCAGSSVSWPPPCF